jgi:hypothetical protein
LTPQPLPISLPRYLPLEDYMRLTVINRTNGLLVLPAPVSQEIPPSSKRSFDHINPTDLSRNSVVWESIKDAGAIDYYIGDDPNSDDDFEVVTSGAVAHAYHLYVDPIIGHDENDGTFARPVQSIQRALDLGAQVPLSSTSDVVCVNLPSANLLIDSAEGLTYHGTNALMLKGAGYNATRLTNALGPVLTVTNATPESLLAYNVSGTYSDLVNQGDAGCVRFFVQDVGMYSSGGLGFGIRALGVGGDAGVGLTAFGGLSLIQAQIQGLVGGVYARNCYSVVGLNLTVWTRYTFINTGYVLFIHSMARHITTTYDSLDPEGQPAAGFIFQGGYDMHQWGNLTVGGEESFMIWSGHTDGNIYVNDTATVSLNGYGVTGREDINDTATLIHEGGYVGSNVLVEGGASWRGNGVHVQGNLNFAAGAGTAQMDGGRYMGSLTDPGVKLVRNAGN